jgi:uncharacterized protein
LILKDGEKMNPEILHDPDKEKFFTMEDGKESFLSYKMKDENKTIEYRHTFVPEEQRSEGKADNLAEYGLQFAEQNKLKVIPTCDFMKQYLEKNDRYKHLLKENN